MCLSLRGVTVHRRSIRKVLVVDDDETLLGSWKRVISRDHTVATASDPALALRLAASLEPDLAIVDLRLGNSSGIELVRALKRDHANVLVALCSGYLSVSAAVSGVRAGADVVVFKPVTFKEILRRLDEHDDETPEVEEPPTLARAEWEHITRILADCNGNVSHAAKRLGIYRSSLQRKLRKLAPRR